MIQSIIFSCEREHILNQAITELKQVSNVVVFDDHSSFTISGVRTFRNPRRHGKKMFYLTWQNAYKFTKKCSADFFLFAPDDFINYDFPRMMTMIDALQSTGDLWALHLHRDDRVECWRKFYPVEHEIKGCKFTEVGFVDCAYIVPRKTLEALEYQSPTVPLAWCQNFGSSGVGKYQSNYFATKGVKMYLPEKSICTHAGNDCSVMHPVERKKNPLISK